MQEASDKISKLESGIKIAPPVLSVQSSTGIPFTEARVCLVEGAQGDGKSTTGVARIRDAYDKDCVRVFCEERLRIRCLVKSYDRKNRIARIKYKGVIRHIRIPTDYKLHSPIKIFSNLHLFGIKYRFCPSFDYIMRWLKQGIMVDGWLLIDEAYLGMNARGCMTALGKELESQYFQFRKMRLNVVIITPMARLIDWTMRTIPTEHIHCNYNTKNYKVTLSIRKKGIQGERKVDYDARQYWPNFNTNERIIQ